jgi:hypothetical protein
MIARGMKYQYLLMEGFGVRAQNYRGLVSSGSLLLITAVLDCLNYFHFL